jgi:hypothetical protein
MRDEGRKEYEAKYTGQRNYEMLMAVYQSARARHPRQLSKEATLTPIAASRA